MARVFRRTYRGDDGRQHATPKWYIEFKDHHDLARRHGGQVQHRPHGPQIERLVSCRISPAEPDRDLSTWVESLPPSVVQQLAQFDLIDAGRLAAGQPLDEHVTDFGDDLRRRGRSEVHVAQSLSRARRVITAAGARYWSDLTAERIERALAKVQADDGLSPKTRNAYLTALRMFANWMTSPKVRRAAASPAEAVEMLDVEEREYRRAFTTDELQRLILAAAEGSPRFAVRRDGSHRWHLTGPERACLYSVAAQTGLRASALRRLRVDDLELDTEQPCVKVKGKAATKNRRDMTQPLQPQTAALLRSMLHGRLPESPAFVVPPEAAEMLRADLADARAAWIAEGQDARQRAERAQGGFLAEVDAEGRRVDFHALRTTTGTMLALADVPRAVTQRIMGHANFSTTDRFYTRIGREAGRSAVELLPDLTPQVVLATGTDGKAIPTVRPTVRNRGGSLMIHDDGGASGKVAGRTGGSSGNATKQEVSGAGGGNTHGAIRTHDLRIRSPLLYPAELRGHDGVQGTGFGVQGLAALTGCIGVTPAPDARFLIPGPWSLNPM